ncbi:MAG: DUF6660 family protein [Bacteroidota bacterium]
MKILSFFFAFYILSLCAYPCQDNGNHEDLGTQTIIKKKACTGHGDSNGCHKCSPFCFCNCCQVNTVITLPFNLQMAVTVPVVYYTQNIESPLPDVSELIWQPPKLPI